MQILKQMLFQDERSGKFSTSKFMLLVTFYLILFINIKSLYLDREIKNTTFLSEILMVTAGLYFGRKFNLKTKGVEVGGEKIE